MDILNDIIVLKSVYGKTSGQVFYICPTINPATGQFPDHVREVDEHGRMILSELDKNDMSRGKIFLPADKPIAVKNNTKFNLNDPLQKAQWEAIKYSPFIAPDRAARDANGNLLIDGEGPSATLDTKSNGVHFDRIIKGRYGLADLYVEHPGRESKIKNERRKLVHTAQAYIYNDSLDGMLRTCRLLERDMSRSNSNDVTDYLLGVAEKDPQKIIDLYQGPTAPVRLLIIDAMSKHIIIRREKWLIYADNVMLGMSVDQAVEFLMKSNNARVREMIHKETYPHLYETEDTASEPKSKTKK